MLKKPTFNNYNLVFLVVLTLISIRISDFEFTSVEINSYDINNPITKLNRHVLAGILITKNSLVFNGSSGKIIVINTKKSNYSELINYISEATNHIKSELRVQYNICQKLNRNNIGDCDDYLYDENKYKIQTKLITSNNNILMFIFAALLTSLIIKIGLKAIPVVIFISLMQVFYASNIAHNNEYGGYYRYIYSVPYYIFDTNNTSNTYLMEFKKIVGCNNLPYYMTRFINGNAIEVLSKEPNLDNCLFKSDYSYLVPQNRKTSYMLDPITLVRKYQP